MKKKLFKSVLVFSLLLITFFSIKLVSKAYSFTYSNFDWNQLLKENPNYWLSVCEEEDSECVDKVLETKERFYKRLYELLDKVQKDYGYNIDDKYIIATVFYGLTPDTFKDPIDEEEFNPFNLDDLIDSLTKNRFIGIILDNEKTEAKSYFDKEADSLKTLVNYFIGYRSTCYGTSDTKPQLQTDENGNKYYVCPEDFIVYNNNCVAKVDTYKGTLFDKLGLSFFGLGNDLEKKCEEKTKEEYVDSFVEISDAQEANVDFFWQSLENSKYFDNKKHLQSYFDAVFQYTGYNSMDEFYKAAETDQTLIDKYEKEIVEARIRIIDGIKSIIATYDLGNKQLSSTYNTVSSSSYWWPIGSLETTSDGDLTFASGAPEKTYVSSKYGFRIHPLTGVRKKHTGIDIPGTLNTTNVIASKDGVVVKSTNSLGISCADTGGLDKCGGGYGNHIIIQHSDGNYTFYGHLAQGSITIQEGDSVKQGQVIAKVGHSGYSTGAHLHFEVRVGGNTSSSTQDPLNYVSQDDPRTVSSIGEIVIPDEYGNSGFFTYTVLTRHNWKYDQKKVYDAWIKSGAQHDRGLATIDGRYLIACTTTFGNIGDKIDFYLGDGTKLETIMMDAKSQEYVAWDHNPANKWGHTDGQQIIEFELVSSSYDANRSGDAGKLIGCSGKRVASATNLGENIIK